MTTNYARIPGPGDAWGPPADGPTVCPDCDGTGKKLYPGDEQFDPEWGTCDVCDGAGHFDDNGNPINLEN